MQKPKTQITFQTEIEKCKVDSLTLMNIPAKIDPLNLTASLEPDLQSQQHKRVWKVHTQPARLHSDSILHSHQQFQPK